jgi:hypothetical protein
VGGAYIYIDPTPSKNVFKVNIDVVQRNMGAIRRCVGMGALRPCAGAGMGRGMV